MSPKMTLVLHHGGKFRRNNNGVLQYVGAEIDCLEKLDIDTMNIFGVIDLCKGHGYHKIERCYWLVPDRDLDIGLRELKVDSDILDMCIASKCNNGEIDLYFEHLVIVDPEIVENIDITVENEPNSPLQWVGCEGISVGKNQARLDDIESFTDDESTEDRSPPFVTKEHEEKCGDGEFEGNNSFHSEELNSPISSNDDGASPTDVFPQFNETATFGHVNIEIGMVFSTLQHFKAAVKDYTIYYGREIKWVKNDKVRARAKCKQCAWEIYCAWSNANKFFQVKTFNDKHTCSRGFKNKQANRKWVMRKLEAKLRTQPNLKHAEALDYMKHEFGVHLDDTKIYRSMKEARKLVEGNEREQYARLWEKTDFTQSAPPPIRRPAGIPEKQWRKDGKDLLMNDHRLKRSFANIICSRCGGSNHNSRSCRYQGVPQQTRHQKQNQTENEDRTPSEIDFSQSPPLSQPESSQPTTAMECAGGTSTMHSL